MRLKTNRRLFLLAAVVAVLAAGAFFVLVVRPWQKRRISGSFFAEGQEAFKQKDYYRALGSTAQYITRVKNDPSRLKDPHYPEALLAYAESRMKIEEPDAHHLTEAIPWYVQYLDLRSDDAETRMKLLKLYNQRGYFAEARDLAEKKMLPLDLSQATAAHVPVLRELSVALVMPPKNDLSDPAIARPIDRLLALAPLDIRGNISRFYVDAATGRKADARARAEKLLKEHPDDPAACVIAAYSRQVDASGADLAERHELLCRAAGLDPRNAARVKPATYADEDYVLELVNAFDTMRNFDFSTAVLADAADKVRSESVDRLLARRLWQDGENEKLLARTAGANPDSRDVHTEVLGFRALSLQRTGKPEEAARIAAALKKRDGDFRAGAWSAAIPLCDAAHPEDPAKAVAAWKDIVADKACPGEPVFWTTYGVTLANLGRSEDARAAWDRARKCPVGASWAVPAHLRAESYLAEGRAEEAAQAADDAVLTSPNRANIIVTWFETQSARIQKGSTEPPNAAFVLAKLEEALPKFDEAPGQTGRALRDRLVVPRVVLLSRANRKDDAKRIGLAAVNSEPPPSTETLQRLAAVSATERLGFEDQCMQRVEAVAGATSSVVYVKAVQLADAGKPEEGVSLLKDAVRKSPADAGAEMMLARFLERLNRPEAKDAWVKLGDGHPKDLNVQKACLQSGSSIADRAFIDRTVERYAALLGAEPGAADGIAFVARARALMHNAPTKADRDQAVALLTAVVAAQPRQAEPKFLLSQALAYADPDRGISPDLPRATTQMAEAAALEPRNAVLGLEHARFLQRQREFDRAREVLYRFAGDPTMEDGVRRAACELLIAQGEPAGVATTTLAELVGKAGEKGDAALLVVLAEAYLAQRQDAQALPLYERLAQGAATDADSIFMTAKFFSMRGDNAKADALVARLDSLALEPGIKDYAMARLAAEKNDVPNASARFEAAVKAAPNRTDIWRQYCAFLLRSGKAPEALQVVQRAAGANPSDRGLAALVEQTRILASGGAKVELKDLIAAISRDPAMSEAVEALKVLEESLNKGEALTVEKFAAVADRYPGCVPLQLFVARRLAPQAPDRAAIIARRTMDANPADPAPARAAAELYLMTKRWDDLLAAAKAWQQRDASRPIEADVAVAEAYLRLKQVDKGLEILAPRLAAAVANPDVPDSLRVLNIHARLLVAAGREPEARNVLAPLLPKSSNLRMLVWLATATEEIPALPVAIAWLEQLDPVIPADAADERIALITGYTLLADRFTDQADSLLKTAATKFEQMTGSAAGGTAAVWESLGVIRHRVNDLTGAEAAYRKAIELDPQRSVSMNNLASILAESGGKPEEALTLAKRAAEIQPRPENFDTLAAVHVALAHRAESQNAPGAADHYKAAAAVFRRIVDLVPGDPRPLMAAATMFESGKDYANAAECYQALLNEQGLSPQIAAGAKNNIAMCLVRLNRSKDDLERAVALATDAVKIMDQPAFIDTLGWCQLAAGRPTMAAEAFRTAIKKAEEMKKAGQIRDAGPSSSIGLATALSRGSPPEREEAKRILDGIDSSKLEAEDADRYKRAKQALVALR